MFLSVVHLRELRCALCAALLAPAGARSFIVDESGDPVAFETEHVPEEMRVALQCENGHVTELAIPSEASAEQSLDTPDDAPIGKDAVLIR